MTELQALTENGIDYTLRESYFVWEIIPRQPSLVVISIPHDGFPAQDFAGLVQPLLLDKVNSGLLPTRDLNIWPIAKDIARQVPVTIVRGLLPRSFIDYNRKRPWIAEDEQRNLEEPDANLILGQQLWDCYHGKLLSAMRLALQARSDSKVSDVVHPLLLDLHGFSEYPDYGEYDLIFGTLNGETTNSPIDAHLAAHLIDLGYRVFLPRRKHRENMTIGKDDKYPGGEIIRRCHKKTMSPCIQIEIHQSFQTLANRDRGVKLADDLSSFIRHYNDIAEQLKFHIPNKLSIDQ